MRGETHKRWLANRQKTLAKEQRIRDEQREREQGWVRRASESGKEVRERARAQCVNDTPCDNCNTSGTVHITVQPAVYTPSGGMTSPSVTVNLCFDCVTSRRLVTVVAGLVTPKQVVEERRQLEQSLRAEQRAEDKAAQEILFVDAPQNPLMKDT